jgi:hypothetical protein
VTVPTVERGLREVALLDRDRRRETSIESTSGFSI